MMSRYTLSAVGVLTIAHLVHAATYSLALKQTEFSDAGHAPFTLTFTNVPAPTSGGTIRVRAFGDLGSASEYLEIYVDGIYFGPILNNNATDDSFNHPTGTDQGYDYESSSLVSNQTAPISLAQLTAMTSNGSIAVLVDPSQSVNNAKAGEFVELTLTYDYASAGACCVGSSHTCQDLPPDPCATAGGTYAGDGTSCASHACFPEGACCLPDGTCQGDALSPEQCTALDGTFQGSGSTCAASDCRLKGACCVNGACSVQAEADCIAADGRYGGNNSICDDPDLDGVQGACDRCPATIPGVTVNPNGCPPDIRGDYDHDGDVDVTDFDVFKACADGPAIPRDANCGSSDFDADNDVDMDDFGTFQRCLSGENVPADPGCS